MKGQLIDTNVLSELRKSDRANDGVRRWFDEARHTTLWVSSLVIGEIWIGIHRISQRDPDQGAALERWAMQLQSEFGERILPVDTAVAKVWAEVASPRPIPVVDGLIASTAIHHDLVLVTRNLKDVELTGVDAYDPFTQ